jgi:hypothetical protein
MAGAEQERTAIWLTMFLVSFKTANNDNYHRFLGHRSYFTAICFQSIKRVSVVDYDAGGKGRITAKADLVLCASSPSFL